jgi:hypothetical protein
VGLHSNNNPPPLVAAGDRGGFKEGFVVDVVLTTTRPFRTFCSFVYQGPNSLLLLPSAFCSYCL